MTTHNTKPFAPCLGRGLLALALALSAFGALAQSKGLEDIDIFVKAPGAGDLPNVLLLLDTSANWSSAAATACAKYADGTPGPSPSKEQGKKIAIQKCALVNTLLALPVNADGTAKFRVGVMYMNAPNANGAYPRVRFLELTAPNKTILADALKATSIDGVGDQGSNADYARGLWEAYLWYGGKPPLYGRAQTNAERVKYDNAAFDPPATGNYLPPALAGCAANYVIIISNGSPQGNEADIKPLVAAAGGNVSEISYPSTYVSTSDKNNWADETARFVQQVGVTGPKSTEKITVFSVAITVSDPTPAERRSNNFIKEIAIQGGGSGYSATSVDELQAALRDIFNKIQAVNSVFASASLPVSVNAQGTFLNQVFMGMFRPDNIGRPRWVGNLKQYQFGYNPATQKVDLVDATGAPAVNPGTGFIAPGALSLWTSNSAFWANTEWPGEVNVGGANDAPDGQIVEKGGAAQRLRERFATSQGGRKVYTTTASRVGLVDFDKTNTTLLTPARMGVADAAQRDALVDWARGADNKSPSDEKGPGGTITVRPSLHGDVIHSSPAVINYGGTTGVIAFYGTNGGMLHAVKGSRTAAGSGDELWSFVPYEFLPKFKRLRDNTVKVQFGNTDMTQVPTPQRKDYAMDGPITFYQNTATNKVYLYAAMRRGGRTLYAFDVSNPALPTLMWSVSNTTTGLDSLGQTWSEARVTRVVGIDDPVLIMGGGYDPAEDADTPSTSMGNSVVILNARTGALLKAFTGLSRPVPAAVAMVDVDGDRRTERAYAVDLGGSVYRILLPGADTAAWSITKIADFSASTGTGQKMFYAPAVTPTVIGGKTVYAIMVGTGDREKPLQASGTENRYFTVLDRGQADAKTIGDLEKMGLTGLTSIKDDKFGCYLDLPNAGEKVVNAVTYTSGFSFFATNGPAKKEALACTGDLGQARSYAIPALCGPVKVTDLVGGGFPPTAVVGTVLIPPPPTDGIPVDCETTPQLCRRVPVGIGVSPPDCAGGASTLTSAIGATNVYACAPAVRQRRDWSIPAPR